MSISMNIISLLDNTDSPFQSSPTHWNDSMIEEIITPYGKSANYMSKRSEMIVRKAGETPSIKSFSSLLMDDEDSGLGMENDSVAGSFKNDLKSSSNSELDGSFTDFNIHRTPSFRKFRSVGVKKSLFSGKRCADLDEDEKQSPSLKKMRNSEPSLMKLALINSPVIDEVHSIIIAVDKLTTDDNLVADGSRDYSLPTISGKHSDLKTISPQTMSEVLNGQHVNDTDDVMVIDCRYPYEFEGGHIKGAVNLYTKDAVHKLMELTFTKKPKILVFHCEFSSERGPKMYRFLRSQDRQFNKDIYPKLNFPEVYLLEGGYKAFYHSYPALCDPVAYKPMLHENHAADLRHFRVKSKSWAGNLGQNKQHQKSRLRSCLSFKY